MKLSGDDLRALATRAEEAARRAGAFIATSRPSAVELKSTGTSAASQVVTEIDRKAEVLILESLESTLETFGLGVLSEERPDNGQRLEKAHFWCIDPLDGTLPFIEGTSGFAVSIALVARDGAPLVGVVFDPVRGTLYRSARGLGLLRNDQPWIVATAAPGAELSVFLDRSAREAPGFAPLARALGNVAGALGCSGVSFHARAGAVMNACQVLEEPPACYLKFPKPAPGGGSLWDFAATACLFGEAGAVATDIHGAPLDLNRPDSTFMNHRGVLFATDARLADRLRALYASP